MNTAPALSHKEFLKVDKDYEKAASAAHLVYVSDQRPGLTRVKKGKGYAYRLNSSLIRDKNEILRIRKLAIPPSWTRVWICPDPKGHIQATGIDLRGRKQYRYHTLWNELRAETKFHRLYEFGKMLPILRRKMEEDLRRKDLCQAKVLATVISLMERTYIRVGNSEYEKMNGSYGLTTMKNQHVEISGDKLVFSFTGKKGVRHNITLRNKRLARIVGQCHDIPGKELFQYINEEGERRSVDSGMVNEYIREAAEKDFSAKDFRTWAGSLHALEAFRTLGEAASVADQKKNLAAMLGAVSEKLGNTRSVCRKYYIHPALIQLYEEGRLLKYLEEKMPGAGTDAPSSEMSQKEEGWTTEEKILMNILKQYIR
ncbi:MAG: DNA topoisomerase IB [Bacteroidota bacterium]|nr:DNA topoisomerase IB [Bacteroidota bacterium]